MLFVLAVAAAPFLSHGIIEFLAVSARKWSVNLRWPRHHVGKVPSLGIRIELLVELRVQQGLFHGGDVEQGAGVVSSHQNGRVGMVRGIGRRMGLSSS